MSAERRNIMLCSSPREREEKRGDKPPLPRKPHELVIEAVSPQVDGGRFPVKRIVGDEVLVGADMYKDGHDLLAGRIRFQAPGESQWRHAGLQYDYDSDRWYGRFVVDRMGRWLFTVEGWADAFGSWQAELQKRMDAAQDVAGELLEGAALVEGALRFLPAPTTKKVQTYLDILSDTDALLERRVETALSEQLRNLMEGAVDPERIVRYERELTIVVNRERARFGAWYEMFPRSQGRIPGKHATLREAAERLRAISEMGFDIVYLPPIHPVGTTKRKGPNNTPSVSPDDPGSPWAIGSEYGGHTAIDPRLGTLKDFAYFVDTARELGMEVALDYALQCSPDHPWLKEHPDWFFVRRDGAIRYAENPPKKYEDIYPLNFRCEDWRRLWAACRDILLFWIEQGVRAFRVDNPHTKPLSFWEWLIEDVHRAHPDVIFLSEAFTRPKRMKGLAKLGFTQSYTYFTWRNTAHELCEYLTELAQAEMTEYFQPNFFTNTPDILHAYLQEGGRPAFRVRLLLAATLSPTYGMYSGFELCENTPLKPGSEEYLHSEKYEIRVRDWNAPGNINDDVQLINRIRREQPALRQLTNLRFYPTSNEQILFYVKYHFAADLLVAVNLDPHHAQEAFFEVPLAELGLDPARPFTVRDLLSQERYIWRGSRNYVKLDPATRVGHVFQILRD